MTDSIPCPFCREDMNATAIKCPRCHEFLPSAAHGRAAAGGNSLASDVLSLIGKLAVPATILIVALIFKPTLEGLIRRATQAEFLGTKIVFGETKAFTGDLTPSELYYLIGSAKNYGRGSGARGGWNYDSLKRDGQDRIFTSLKEKGLLDFFVEEYKGENAKYFGAQSLEAWPTEKGKDFLIELGLKFDGQSFSEAPL